MCDRGVQQEGRASLSSDRHFEGIIWEQTYRSEGKSFPLETEQGRRKPPLLACSSAQVKSSDARNRRELLPKKDLKISTTPEPGATFQASHLSSQRFSSVQPCKTRNRFTEAGISPLLLFLGARAKDQA